LLFDCRGETVCYSSCDVVTFFRQALLTPGAFLILSGSLVNQFAVILGKILLGLTGADFYALSICEDNIFPGFGSLSLKSTPHSLVLLRREFIYGFSPDRFFSRGFLSFNFPPFPQQKSPAARFPLPLRLIFEPNAGSHF